MKWPRKVFHPKGPKDPFTQKIHEALGGQVLRTGLAAPSPEEPVRDLEREIVELRERIAKLESIILPMRNGIPAH